MLALLIVGATMISCSGERSVLGHKLALSGSPRTALVPDNEFLGWRNAYYGSTDDKTRIYYRNLIVRRLMLYDDEFFRAWSQQMYGGRAITNTLGDFATGLMSAIAGATGSDDVSKGLNLAITGITGARMAVDKNIFLEQAAGALISQMRAERAKVDTQISQYLKQSSLNYPLDQALRDLVRYYEAGTLAHAAEALKADATEAARVAKAMTEAAKGDLLVAPAELSRSEAELEAQKRVQTLLNQKLQPPKPAPTPPVKVTLDSTTAFGNKIGELLKNREIKQWDKDDPVFGEILKAARIPIPAAPGRTANFVMDKYDSNETTTKQKEDLVKALNHQLKIVPNPQPNPAQ